LEGSASGIMDQNGVPEEDLSRWQKKIYSVLDDLHSGKLKPENLDRGLFNLTLNDLVNGFNQGMRIGIDVNYNDPNYNFVSDVTRNLYRFAGAKSFQELSEFNKLLIGEDGKLVSFADFRDSIELYRSQALSLDETYNRSWLYTEYNNAVNSSLAAKRWDEFQQTADVFPNLEYRTVGDALVRPEHEELNGIIRPINDPFWDEYYPPNDWGCRCRARPTSDPVTPGRDLPEIPEAFRNNVGKTAEVFTADHPYFSENKIRSSKTFASVANFFREDYSLVQGPAYEEAQKRYDLISSMNDLGGSLFQEKGFTAAGKALETARKLSGGGDLVVLLSQDKTQATALVQGLKSTFVEVSAKSDITAGIQDALGTSRVVTLDLPEQISAKKLKSSLSTVSADPRLAAAILLRGGKKCVLTSRDITLEKWHLLKKIGY